MDSINGNQQLSLTVLLEVTERCNHRCLHCYKGFDQVEDNTEFNAEKIDFVLDKIFAHKDRFISLTLTGGEPTLNMPMCERVLERVTEENKTRPEDKRVIVKINTNFTQDITPFAKYFHPELCKYFFVVSVPSLNRELYNKITVTTTSFDKMMNNFKNFEKHFDTLEMIQANIVLNQQNKHDVLSTVKRLVMLGIRHINTAMVYPRVDYSNDKIIIDYDEIKDVYESVFKLFDNIKDTVFTANTTHIPICKAPQNPKYIKSFTGSFCQYDSNRFAIKPNGTTKTCAVMPDDISVGNFFEDSMECICKNSEYWNDCRNFIPEKCQECALFPKHCQGGCKLFSIFDNPEYFKEKLNLHSIIQKIDFNPVPYTKDSIIYKVFEGIEEE